jgi:hypothetical protein
MADCNTTPALTIDKILKALNNQNLGESDVLRDTTYKLLEKHIECASSDDYVKILMEISTFKFNAGIRNIRYRILSDFFKTIKSNIKVNATKYVELINNIVNYESNKMNEIVKLFFEKIIPENSQEIDCNLLLQTILEGKSDYTEIPQIVTICFNFIIPVLIPSFIADKHKIDSYLHMITQYDSQRNTELLMPHFIKIMNDSLNKLNNNEQKKSLITHIRAVLSTYVSSIHQTSLNKDLNIIQSRYPDIVKKLEEEMKKGGMRSRRMKRRISKTRGKQRRRYKSTKRGRRSRSN